MGWGARTGIGGGGDELCTLGAVAGTILGAIGGGDDELCTLGAAGGTTLGTGAKTGWCPTLGERVSCLEGEEDSSRGGDDAACGRRETGDVSSFHLLKISRSLSMAMSWALMESSVASLMVVERKLIAWRSRSS